MDTIALDKKFAGTFPEKGEARSQNTIESEPAIERITLVQEDRAVGFEGDEDKKDPSAIITHPPIPQPKKVRRLAVRDKAFISTFIGGAVALSLFWLVSVPPEEAAKIGLGVGLLAAHAKKIWLTLKTSKWVAALIPVVAREAKSRAKKEVTVRAQSWIERQWQKIFPPKKKKTEEETTDQP